MNILQSPNPRLNNNIDNDKSSSTPMLTPRYWGKNVLSAMVKRRNFLHPYKPPYISTNHFRLIRSDRMPYQFHHARSDLRDKSPESSRDFRFLRNNRKLISVIPHDYFASPDYSTNLNTRAVKNYNTVRNEIASISSLDDIQSTLRPGMNERKFTSKATLNNPMSRSVNIDYSNVMYPNSTSGNNVALIQSKLLGHLTLAHLPPMIRRSTIGQNSSMQNDQNSRAQKAAASSIRITAVNSAKATESTGAYNMGKSGSPLSKGLSDDANHLGFDRSVRPEMYDAPNFGSNSLNRIQRRVTGELWLDTISFQDWLEEHLNGQSRSMSWFPEGIEGQG